MPIRSAPLRDVSLEPAHRCGSTALRCNGIRPWWQSTTLVRLHCNNYGRPTSTTSSLRLNGTPGPTRKARSACGRGVGVVAAALQSRHTPRPSPRARQNSRHCRKSLSLVIPQTDPFRPRLHRLADRGENITATYESNSIPTCSIVAASTQEYPDCPFDHAPCRMKWAYNQIDVLDRRSSFNLGCSWSRRPAAPV